MTFLDLSLPLAGRYFAGAFATYLLLVFGYRLLLHPLRNYPGPFVAKLTDAYGGFYAILRRYHLVTQQNHEKYGRVVRVAPNRLVFNSAKALHDIYDNYRAVKSKVYLVTLGFTGTINVFSAIDKAAHRAKRKLIGSAVTERSMRGFEPTMAGQIDIYLKQILTSSQASSPVDISVRCKHLGSDIVGLLAFGYPLKTQTEETYRSLHQGIAAGSHHNNVMMQWPLLASYLIAKPIHLATKHLEKAALDMVEHMINTRLAEGQHARHDLYSQVADQLQANPDMRLSDIWSEALFFLPAGGDTASAATSATFFYLTRNPACYQKLAAEIRTTFSSGSDIHGGPKLTGCQYLRACIDESMRISPPVNGTLWRELAADDNDGTPFVVDGHVVPKGVQVGVSIYTLHHNAEYFPDPYAYRPERWLESDEAERRRMSEAFAPFLVGYRGCAGKAMAYLEVSLVLAKTLWYFDFEAAPGEAGKVGGGWAGDSTGRHRPGEFQMYDIFTSDYEGPSLVFHPRGDSWKDLVAE